MDAGTIDRGVPLLDLGADSLVLVELSREVKTRFDVDISVQQLLEDIVTVRAISRWVTESLPRADEPPARPEPVPAAEPAPRRAPGPSYAAATARSRALSERSQGHLVNNRKIAQREHEERAASYPIWITRSEGAHVWDVDGRRLVDLTMGYGAHLFGHNPDFVRAAVEQQVARGLHIGAEVEQTAEVARLLCELTGMDRVNFCVTGTEAVFTAIRLARARTGRSLVVLLRNAYHGHSDTTLFSPRPGRRRERLATPSFPGVSPGAAEDVRVLPADEAQLSEFMAAHGHEVAAVVMEPRLNQSPDIDLGGLARRARVLTERAGALLVFDEVLTGFRFHVQGFQGVYGVRADLVTYGKTLAAGLPMAAVAGRADVMDLIDGGPWTDEVRADPDQVSFTGGTYAKHPLSVAAAHAVLTELATGGDTVLADLNAAGERLRHDIEGVLAGSGVRVLGTGSFFRFTPEKSTSFAYGGKAFHRFRRELIAEGVLIPETGNCFLSPAHTPDVRRAVLDAVAAAVQRLARGDEAPAEPAAAAPAVSLALFGFTGEGGSEVYSRLLRLVESAEAEGLANVWLPERHFDDFAGFSPNPAVLGAMVAARTSRIGIRAGSSVLPLHSAVSVAEDWAMVDVASGGRVGLGVASGWMRRDFVLSEAPHAERRELFRERVAQLERLWRGEAVAVRGHSGEQAEVRLHPRPVSELRLWQACLGTPESFYEAGRAGRGVLTNLIQQDLARLRAGLERYRQGRRDGGLPADGGEVAVLLHAAVSTGDESDRRNREALQQYMFATFRATHDDPAQVREETWKPRMAAAADRLRAGLSLVGSEADWPALTAELARLGVTEIACLVDFLPQGPAWTDTVRALGRLHERTAEALQTPPAAPEQDSLPTPAQPAAPQRAGAREQTSTPERLTGPAGETGAFPVQISRAAREIWAACQISAQTRDAYNIARTFVVAPGLDLGRLRQAFLDAVAAQPAYRLRIDADGAAGWVEPFGEAHERGWRVLDGVADSTERFEAAVRAGCADTPLDPVERFAVRLTCQRAAEGVLVNLSASHIVVDGMRFAELLASVAARYAGKPVQEPALPPAAEVDAAARERDRAYWDRWVRALPDEVFDAGFDARTLDRAGYRLSAPLPPGLREGLAAYARAERSTPFAEALRAVAEIVDDALGREHLYAFPARPPVAEYGSGAVLVPFRRGSGADAKQAVLSGVRHGSLTFRQVFADVTRRVQTPAVTVAWDDLAAFTVDGHRVDEVSAPTDVVRFPLTVTFTQRPSGGVELSLDAARGFLPRERGELLLERLTRGLGQRFEPEPEVTGAELAALVRGLVSPPEDVGAARVRLDGRDCPVELVVAKARSSARILAVEEPGLLAVAAVAVEVDTAFNAVVALLATGMTGLAGRVGVTGSPRLVVGPPGRDPAAGDTGFAVTRWTVVGADEALPLSPSSAGELDAALAHVLRPLAPGQRADVVAALRAMAAEFGAAAEAPDGRVPELVRGIWRRVLDDPAVFGDEDDFFDLGGDSIDAIRIMAILNQELGTELEVALIFDNPTVGGLSDAVLSRA
ncbi:MupA/Atu3671 family FMN-dependent luciferase-like monooxygenase [Actinokineospora pegani]|uniref:MupA/Atu3671 family FMN-dependent luciferase-like monooxygenase n=1 Tax=Actinokineospora pegani TaxID=2654637 RepID=UPI0022A6DF9F|nr:MupA/Atu3671 family FMN-dependent luciferase-like monooxygenase [Actinokineospora pegani]